MQNKKFDQISIEEFDSMNMDHTFSDNYNRKKQNLLHAVSESEHNRHRNHLYRVAAAVVALSLLPATAYAADRLLQMHYNSTGTYSGDLSLTTTSKDTVFSPVKLTPTYCLMEVLLLQTVDRTSTRFHPTLNLLHTVLHFLSIKWIPIILHFHNPI